jgi:FAD/FMN-containing dehydrogenase
MRVLLAEITAVVGSSYLLEGDDVSAHRDDWMQGTPCRARAIVRSTAAEITLMRTLKQALGPHALLNHHKILPDEVP